MASVRSEYQKGPALGFHSWPCAAAKQRDEKVCLLTAPHFQRSEV